MRSDQALSVASFALALLAASASAVPLSNVQFLAGADCGTGPMQACFNHLDFGTLGSADLSGSANLTFGLVPTISVSGTVVSMPHPQTFLSPGASVAANGSIRYELELFEDANPPLGVPLQVVPVRVKASGMGMSGTGMYTARVTVGRPGLAPLLDLSAGTHSPNPSFSTNFPLLLVPGSVYEISIVAGCTAVVNPQVFHVPDACSAFADPEFTFDQAAFDLSQGANTFQLDTFYSFRYSPGLVPEPVSGVLVWVAAMAMAVARRASHGPLG